MEKPSFEGGEDGMGQPLTNKELELCAFGRNITSSLSDMLLLGWEIFASIIKLHLEATLPSSLLQRCIKMLENMHVVKSRLQPGLTKRCSMSKSNPEL